MKRSADLNPKTVLRCQRVGAALGVGFIGLLFTLAGTLLAAILIKVVRCWLKILG